MHSQVAVVNFNNQWFDTLTARLGYAVVPNWLLYFQGGAAWGHTSTNVTLNGLQIGQTSNTKQAGRSVVALNGCSHRTGRRFWKVITWTSARTIRDPIHCSPSGRRCRSPSSVCQFGCPWSAKATEATVLVGVNYRFW